MSVARIAAAVTALSALLAAIGFAMWVHVPQPKPAHFPTARDRAQAHQQDLDYLQQLVGLDRSFSSTARQAFVQRLGVLRNRAATLDEGAFEMEVARAVALADNGHTNARGVAFDRNLPRIPLRLAWFAEGLFVLRADAEHADCVGARVIAIEGRPPQDLLRTLINYVGGAEPLRRLLSVNFMVAPAALHATGIARSGEELRYELQLTDGRYERLIFRATQPAATSDEDQDRWPARELSPVEAVPTAGSHHVLDRIEALPLYLQQPDDPYWCRRIRKDLLYVHLGRLRNRGPVRLDTFLSKVLDDIESTGVRFVAVDLRASSGGDETLVTSFTARLASVLPANGRVYVLIGPDTFSAGLIMAARLKYFGGSRSLLIGEAMGDRPQFWAEGGRMILPNSRIPVRYATRYHDWRRGCTIRQIGVCHWRMYVAGVAAGDLQPDTHVPQSFAEYARGRDAPLAAVERAIAAVPAAAEQQQ